uniref:conserved oligomeric Golgi complex subunit 2 n=1 Tax=Myxine glutinosa TaxID=7769 RepID=UPI00358F090A
MAEDWQSHMLEADAGSLCFDKNLFMKDDFDVDNFVADCKKHVSLETLREDLEVFYKLLKRSMVELINKDYADFVNLSTNLVGMDKSLSQLTVPLGQLREEVLCVRSVFHEAIGMINDHLEKRADIRKKKTCLQQLMQVIRSVEEIERVLQAQGSQEGSSPGQSSPLAGHVLERIATVFNQLQFYAVQSKGMPLLDVIRPRIADITATLQQSLEGRLLEGLQAGRADSVRQCLRTYSTIDKAHDAEALVAKMLVRPFMDEVITEEFLQRHTLGLRGMYNKLLEFIPHHCHLLKDITMGKATSEERTEVVPGFEFTVNSVWPEIVRALELRLSFLFNPGNPDLFYERYSISFEFLSNFEKQCSSQASVKRLRCHPAYENFHNKWSLPVYFQIRLKEFSGRVETVMMEELQAAPDGSAFRLLVTHTLWVSMEQCWAEPVYLPALAHRFWNVVLELLGRYVCWMNEVLELKTSEVPVAKEQNASLRPSCSNPNLANLNTAAMGLAGTTAALKHSVTVSNLKNEDSTNPEAFAASGCVPSPDQLIAVVADADTLQDKLEDLLTTVVRPRVEDLGFSKHDLLAGALEDSLNGLLAIVPRYVQRVTEELAHACCVSLRSAQDVPRLYRRTNKEVPSKPSPYIESAMRPLQRLVSDHASFLQPSRLHSCLVAIVCVCTERYQETVSEVLTSVRKMEESLKRLMQARRTNPPVASARGAGTSDDDRIRLQLHLDVRAFSSQVECLGISFAEVPPLQPLMETVRASLAFLSDDASSPATIAP